MKRIKSKQIDLEREKSKVRFNKNIASQSFVTSATAITLISLIVTIIVLLILVGVTLSLIGGDDGIIGKAEDAESVTFNSTVKEETEMAILEKMTEYYDNFDEKISVYSTALDYAKAELAKNKNYITASGAKLVYDAESGEFRYKKNNQEIIMTADENGKIAVGERAIESVYGVTYDANGGEGDVPTDTNDYKEDATVTVSFASIPTRKNYTFLGWSQSPDATEATYKENETITFVMDREAITLYAIWDYQRDGMEDSNQVRALSGSTDEGTYTYKNPVIPKGFIAVDTEDAEWEYTDSDETEVKDWNNGLVIEDANNQNQFVWVPCTIAATSDTVSYSRYSAATGTSYSYGKEATDSISYNNKTYKAIPMTETTQITKYNGFYVSRYEAGYDTTTAANGAKNTYLAPLSKEGTKIWNMVTYPYAYVSAGMMVNDTTKYGNTVSGLITGIQWDTIMQWYNKSSILVGTTQNWGTYYNLGYTIKSGYYFTTSNYSWATGTYTHSANSSPYHFHASGLNENGKKKNIYDIGGNVAEWTAEYNSNSTAQRMCRGGYASTASTAQTASYRWNIASTNSYYYLGFRTVLYVQE